MRNHIQKLSVDDLEWMPTGAPGLMEKIINEDQISGARTLMLKSIPRPGDQISDRRPQYHPVDEEFLCLSGRFTLEGHPWLTQGTYVYYPPNLVHGYAVDVPDGYEIYLRNSGPLSTTRVESPAVNKLHRIDDPDAPASGAVTRHANESLEAARNGQSFSIIGLREACDGCDGAFLIALPRDAQIPSPNGGYDGFLELLVLDGEVESENHATLSSNDYSFLPPETPFDLVGLAPLSCFLVNYSDQNTFIHFAQAASDVVQIPSA